MYKKFYGISYSIFFFFLKFANYTFSFQFQSFLKLFSPIIVKIYRLTKRLFSCIHTYTHTNFDIYEKSNAEIRNGLRWSRWNSMPLVFDRTVTIPTVYKQYYITVLQTGLLTVSILYTRFTIRYTCTRVKAYAFYNTSVL